MHSGMLVRYGIGEADMRETEVTMVRIYLHEAKAHMEELLQYLHDDSKVHGVTVFRGGADPEGEPPGKRPGGGADPHGDP